MLIDSYINSFISFFISFRRLRRVVASTLPDSSASFKAATSCNSASIRSDCSVTLASKLRLNALFRCSSMQSSLGEFSGRRKRKQKEGLCRMVSCSQNGHSEENDGRGETQQLTASWSAFRRIGGGQCRARTCDLVLVRHAL